MVRLAYDDHGSGSVVVLVHGHPFNRTLWQPQVSPLAARYRVITPDLRGFGASPVTAGSVSMRTLADDVQDMLDSLGIGEAAVVGLSMGGLVAMELVISSPNRYWGLGLVATTAEPVTNEEQDFRLSMADRLDTEGMGPWVEHMCAGVFGSASTHEIRARIEQMMRATDPRGAAAALRGRAQRPDYRPGLATYPHRAFVCAGGGDPWTTPKVTAEIVEHLAEPELLALDATIGHLPNLEAGDAFNVGLIGYLDSRRLDAR